MQMSKPNPILVPESELVARIDRKLAPNGTALYRKSHAAEAGQPGLGRYDIIEVATNHLVREDVDLEPLAREIGALAEGEALKV